MTHGVDNYLQAKIFMNANQIEFTKASGLAARSLSEYVALGMLWHAKGVRHFMENQTAKLWAPREVEVVSGKTMVVLGFGSIGSACGKVAKQGFGTRVIGVDLHEVTDPERKACADETVTVDKLSQVVPEADFFVSVLPHTD